MLEEKILRMKSKMLLGVATLGAIAALYACATTSAVNDGVYYPRDNDNAALRFQEEATQHDDFDKAGVFYKYCFSEYTGK